MYPFYQKRIKIWVFRMCKSVQKMSLYELNFHSYYCRPLKNWLINFVFFDIFNTFVHTLFCYIFICKARGIHCVSIFSYHWNHWRIKQFILLFIGDYTHYCKNMPGEISVIHYGVIIGQLNTYKYDMRPTNVPTFLDMISHPTLRKKSGSRTSLCFPSTSLPSHQQKRAH